MRVAFVQLAPVLGDSAATIRKLEGLLPAAGGADLVVLPELCNSGYRFPNRAAARDVAEPVSDSPFLRFLQTVCARQNQYIVTGLNERDGERIYNTAVLVGPDGPAGTYRKLHLFLNEKDLFEPGDRGLPVFALPGCTVGLLICFDWIFPEVWRVLALKGADVIAHPSNLVLPGLCQRAVPIHAVTNRVFVVTANRTGTEGDLTFTGASIIAGPRADVLAQASADGEETAVVDIDVRDARNKAATPRNDVLADRRPGEYALLCRPRSAGG